MPISQTAAQAVQDAMLNLEEVYEAQVAQEGVGEDRRVKGIRRMMYGLHTAMEMLYTAEGGDVSTLSGGSKTDPEPPQDP